MPPPAAPFSLTNADEVRTLLQGAGFGAAEITPVEQTVRYPNLREFVLRTVQTVQAMAAQAMAAIPPDLAALPPEEITVKADGITAEFAPLVQTYRDGDGLAFPMRTNVALVRR